MVPKELGPEPQDQQVLKELKNSRLKVLPVAVIKVLSVLVQRWCWCSRR